MQLVKLSDSSVTIILSSYSLLSKFEVSTFTKNLVLSGDFSTIPDWTTITDDAISYFAVYPSTFVAPTGVSSKYLLQPIGRFSIYTLSKFNCLIIISKFNCFSSFSNLICVLFVALNLISFFDIPNDRFSLSVFMYFENLNFSKADTFPFEVVISEPTTSTFVSAETVGLP